MLLALLLAPLTAYWCADQLVDVIFSLMIPPVVVTLLVCVANMVVRRFAPRWALTEGELIIFYAMHAVLGAICAEWMNIMNPTIHSYALYANSESSFRNLIDPYSSSWFFIPLTDVDKFVDYRNGGFPFSYFLSHIHLWWRYIFAWTGLFTLVCLAMLCINSLMRDEWTNRERLAFPIIQLPLAIVQSGSGRSQVWKSKFFTIPFLIMFGIDMMNGLHVLYPSIPDLNVRYLADLKNFTTSAPWNAIGWTPVGLFPYISVIGFFMPTDLLFSCIFFFFFRKFEQVFSYSLGYTESAGVFGGGGLTPAVPYFSEQSWGAFLALFFTAGWVARTYLKNVWQHILHGNAPRTVGIRRVDETDEEMAKRGRHEQEEEDRGVPHRLAFVGLVLSVASLVVLGMYIGIPFWMVAVTVILFLMFSVALTRMRAQIGAPSHEMAYMGPNQLIVDFVGTRSLPEAGTSRLVTTFFFMNRIHRTHPMPHQLEAMKVGEMARMNQRALFVAIIVATIVGSIFGHLVYIWKGYHYAATHAGNDVAGVIDTMVNKHQDPNPFAILFVVLGFAVVLGLDFLRFRMPGFPLHPAGYALAMNFGLDYFWFGLIIVWLIKLFVERYYGLKGYTKLHEIALGIMLAEFCAETIWAIYSMTTHTATYSISINGRLRWDQ